jgi:small GTP-binding protein
MKTINEIQVESLIEEAKRQREEFENATVKCGIIGLSGAGKSSLINAIAGEKIAATGSTEQTMSAQSHFHNGIEFVDLPGCGTERWPQATYINDLNLTEFDCFIIVTHTRLYESDIYLHQKLKNEMGKPCFVVRNKIDVAIRDEEYDNQLSEQQTIEKVRENILSSITPNTSDVYLTSARQPAKWDLPRLIDDIGASQKGVKRDKFISGMAAWSKAALERKRGVARKFVLWSAVAAAANGLNPIPLADIAVDVGILTAMCKKVSSIYGLTPEQLSYVETTTPGLINSAEFAGIKQHALKWFAKYATTEAVMLVLKNIAGRVVVKNATKLLPFIGSIISAGIGYQMTISFGEQFSEESEDIASKILDEILLNND